MCIQNNAYAQFLPIDVYAEGDLQINLNEKKLTAEKNVRMMQQDTTILCQNMNVYFTGATALSKQPKIFSVSALGNVIVRKQDYTLHAEKLDFDVKTGLLKAYAIPDQYVILCQNTGTCVKAHEMHYNIYEAKGIATGAATFTHSQGSVRSKCIEFYFLGGAKPSNQLLMGNASFKSSGQKAQVYAKAVGDVHIRFKNWKGSACYVQYDQRSEKIVLKGKVRIANNHQHFGMTEHAVIDTKNNIYHVVPTCSRKPTILVIPNRTSKHLRRK